MMMDSPGVTKRVGVDEVEATGLSGAALHDLADIDGEIPALVIALEREHVVLAPLVSTSIRPGAKVKLRGRATVHVDGSLLGRVICGAELVSGPAGPGAPRALFPVPARPRWGAARKRQAFTTGLLVHDVKGELRRGDAILLSGERLGDATPAAFALQVAGHILRHQESVGATCVFARLRSTPDSCDSRELLEAARGVQHLDAGSGTWQRTVFLEAGRGAAPVMSWLLCRAAAAIAQALADRGADVALVVDGADELRRPAFRRLPGVSPFAELGMLTSAADCHEAGSVTVIFTGGGRAPREELSFFDARLDLRRGETGQIAVRRSTLARPPVQLRPMNALRRVLLASQQAEDVPGFAAYSPVVLRGRRVQEALRFRAAAGLDLLEQLLCVLSVERLDSLDVADVPRFVERYIRALRDEHAPYLRSLREASLVADSASETWVTVAAQVAATLGP